MELDAGRPEVGGETELLLMRIRRLKRAERDLRGRLAEHRAALDGAGAPMSDPLHQRLFLILQSLSDQRVSAARELARRAGAAE